MVSIRGNRAVFDAPILLIWGQWHPGTWAGGREVLPAAGASISQSFRLYEWRPRGAPELVSPMVFADFNPEALILNDELNRLLVLSDDGARTVGGVESKRLPDPAQRRFRGNVDATSPPLADFPLLGPGAD